MRPESSPWLTVQQVAKRTQCSTTTILRAIRSGKLRSTPINGGRVHRIHRDWCDAWLGMSPTPEEPRT